MPEGNDPRGYLALGQRIESEIRSAIRFQKARLGQTGRPGESLPAEHLGAYVVTNPITHIDTVVKFSKASTKATESEDGSSRRSSQGRLRSRPSSAASSRPSSSGASTGFLEQHVESLERTLKEERAERLKVQYELGKLQNMLENHLGIKVDGGESADRKPKPAADSRS